MNQHAALGLEDGQAGRGVLMRWKRQQGSKLPLASLNCRRAVSSSKGEILRQSRSSSMNKD